jgi:hypothetical protein
LRRHFSEEQLIELAATAALENFRDADYFVVRSSSVWFDD